MSIEKGEGEESHASFDMEFVLSEANLPASSQS